MVRSSDSNLSQTAKSVVDQAASSELVLPVWTNPATNKTGIKRRWKPNVNKSQQWPQTIQQTVQFMHGLHNHIKKKDHHLLTLKCYFYYISKKEILKLWLTANGQTVSACVRYAGALLGRCTGVLCNGCTRHYMPANNGLCKGLMPNVSSPCISQ